MDKVLAFFSEGTWMRVAITIAVVVIIWIIVDRVLAHLSKKIAPEDGDKNLFLFMRVLKRGVRYVLVIIGALIVLNTMGIKVTSYLAGLGIASVIIGLALQDALKDAINGVNIMVDGYFRTGDYIKYDGRTCLVEDVRIKVTKLEDVITHDHLVVSNRLIQQGVKLSGVYAIVIPTPYEKTYEEVSAVIDEILDEIRKIDVVRDAFSKKITNFGDSSIDYTICVDVGSVQNGIAVTDCNVIIKKKLDEHGIDIPYMQVDVHSK